MKINFYTAVCSLYALATKAHNLAKSVPAEVQQDDLLLLAETDAFDLYQHREEDEDLGALELAQTEALA